MKCSCEISVGVTVDWNKALKRCLVVVLMYKEHSQQSSLFFFLFFFFFFLMRYPKVYGGRVGNGSTSPLESFLDSPQISVSWKFKSIARKNSPGTRNVIKLFIERANANHPTIKFTTEVSAIETTFLDTTVYKGQRFEKKASSMCVHILSYWNTSVHTLQ